MQLVDDDIIDQRYLSSFLVCAVHAAHTARRKLPIGERMPALGRAGDRLRPCQVPYAREGG